MRCTCARTRPARSPAGSRDVAYTVASAESKPFTERPKAPFKTTTMQQEAGNKLRFSAGRTMSVAQGLYERGYITYMRTDSVKLSEQAVDAARAQIVERFGQAYLPPAPRTYANKVKNAQEAHEAIRPAGARFRTPEQVRGELSRDEQALYELIWMRTVASQMPDARGRSLTLRLAGTSSANEQAIFRASGRTYEFLGFRMAYVDVSEEPGVRGRRGEPPGGRRGRRRRVRGDRRAGPLDAAAGPLHRGEPGQGARGPRDRAAVDLRVDHQHDHERARLRLEEGQRARPVVDRVREDAAARALLPAPRRLRRSPRRWRRRSTRSRPVAPRPRSGSTPSTSGTAPRASTSWCRRRTSPRST